MKITKVEVMEFICEGKPFFRVIGCRVHTDEGIYGDGEAALSYGVGASAAFGMVKDLAKLVIGMDPMENEVIWHKLYRTTFWGQAGGPVVYAGISALDVALWDIKGKALGLPIYRLLGGKFREDLRSYASQIHQGFVPRASFTFQFLFLCHNYFNLVRHFAVTNLGTKKIPDKFLCRRFRVLLIITEVYRKLLFFTSKIGPNNSDTAQL